MPYKDPEAQKAAQARWYQENRHRLQERQKAWRKANPEKKRQLDMKWKSENRVLQRGYQAKYWAAHPELREAKYREWRQKYHERRRQYPPELRSIIRLVSTLKRKIGKIDENNS